MQSLLLRSDPLALKVLRGRKEIVQETGAAASIRGLWHGMKGLMDFRSFLTLSVTISVLLAAWCAAGIVTKCDNCLVVVLSGSMEPFYHRTDLLVLHKITPVAVSDVIVFSLPDRKVPVVHRVHRVQVMDGTRHFLTKGDNNEFDDRTLYPDGYHWVREEDVVGKVALLLPNVGFLTIMLEDKPLAKVCLMGVALVWGWFSGM